MVAHVTAGAEEGAPKTLPGLAAILEGAEAGWEEWHEHYVPHVIKMLYAVGVGSIQGIDAKRVNDIACEIMADFFAHYSETIDELREFDDERMLAYLCGMAKNKRMDLLREKKRNGTETPLPDDDRENFLEMNGLAACYTSGPSTPPDVHYDLAETFGLVMNARASMQPTAAEVLKMLVRQTSHKEMARVMGCHVKTVGIKVKRTRKALRAYLEAKHPDWVAATA